MPRGKLLNNFEMGQAIAYDNEGRTQREIATLLCRSQTVICHFLKNKEGYGKQNFKGKSKINSPRSIRALGRTACANKGLTAMQLAVTCCIKGSKSTVCRILKNDLGLKNKKANQIPKLTLCHINSRIEYARENIQINFESGVIFSDEKRFSFSGPDSYYRAW